MNRFGNSFGHGLGPAFEDHASNSPPPACESAAAACAAQVAETLFTDAEEFASLSDWIDAQLIALEDRYAEFTTESSLRSAARRRSSSR